MLKILSPSLGLEWDLLCTKYQQSLIRSEYWFPRYHDFPLFCPVDSCHYKKGSQSLWSVGTLNRLWNLSEIWILVREILPGKVWAILEPFPPFSHPRDIQKKFFSSQKCFFGCQKTYAEKKYGVKNFLANWIFLATKKEARYLIPGISSKEKVGQNLSWTP